MDSKSTVVCYLYHTNQCNQFHILLNEHTQKILSNPALRVRSFAISENSLGLCISTNVQKIKPETIIGIDRNLRNVTVGNNNKVVFFKTNKLFSIKENTIHARAGLKRNDHRIKRKFFQRFNARMQHRSKKFLHIISKQIIDNAKLNKSAIVFENLNGIRKLYRKGNGQGRKYRRKLNSWSFYELQRQVEYKALWEGVQFCLVDPKCTSKLCPVCGKRTQEDRQNRRKLWCNN